MNLVYFHKKVKSYECIQPPSIDLENVPKPEMVIVISLWIYVIELSQKIYLFKLLLFYFLALQVIMLCCLLPVIPLQAYDLLPWLYIPQIFKSYPMIKASCDNNFRFIYECLWYIWFVSSQAACMTIRCSYHIEIIIIR